MGIKQEPYEAQESLKGTLLNFEGFRQELKSCKARYSEQWAASRTYLTADTLPSTIAQLTTHIKASPLDALVQVRLVEVLEQYGQDSKNQATNQALKELTGLPPSKAIRALILWGVLSKEDNQNLGVETLTADQVEAVAKKADNPFELLARSQAPSLLDIGAGDLTFEQELMHQLSPVLREQHLAFTLHAFDRLEPQSRVGGVYHKNVDRERYLQEFPPEELRFKFWGGKNLNQVAGMKGPLRRYTMTTCFAPANPTFAYEPSRVSSKLIQDHLQSTRGTFRVERYGGESILEVSHGDSVLTFPPWKFEILGPLALLDFMAHRSALGVLAAIDDEVFWEMLSQILEGDQYRPQNQIFSKESIPKIFGAVHDELASLKHGDRLDLSSVATLRANIPGPTTKAERKEKPYSLRYVEVRRGAELPGIPSSFTTKQFSRMKEESTPWWMIFVPNHEG